MHRSSLLLTNLQYLMQRISQLQNLLYLVQWSSLLVTKYIIFNVEVQAVSYKIYHI